MISNIHEICIYFIFCSCYCIVYTVNLTSNKFSFYLYRLEMLFYQQLVNACQTHHLHPSQKLGPYLVATIRRTLLRQLMT